MGGVALRGRCWLRVPRIMHQATRRTAPAARRALLICTALLSSLPRRCHAIPHLLNLPPVIEPPNSLCRLVRATRLDVGNPQRPSAEMSCLWRNWP